MGTGPVCVSYLCTTGSVRLVAWEISVASIGAARDGGSRGPWPVEEGRAQVLNKELWPPRVLAIGVV